jgi:VCBS repeat-containing protein
VTVSLTVANDAPVAVNDAYTASRNATQTVPAATGVLFNDSDANGDTLTAIKVTDPAHGVVTLNSNGSFTYTPTTGYTGPDSFTYKANDGVLDSNIATVSFTVTNNAPVAVNDGTYAVSKNNPLTVPAATGVLANDTDANSDALTAIKVSDPAHGIVTVNANGSFTYTPTAGYTGPDSFTYKANDGTADSNVATVSLNVTNDAPVAVADSYNVSKNNPLVVLAPAGVLANDSDANGDTLTAIQVSGPAHAASFTLNANGSFTYTPVAGYTGPDSFSYKPNDGTVDGNTVTVSLTVANNAPVAVNDSYTASQSTPLVVPVATGLLANDTDANGDTLTAIKVTDPAHGAVTVNLDGSFTYTPTTGYVGPDSFTYKANDGTADSTVATVNLNVIATTLRVTSFTPTPTGFTVTFNIPFDNSSINLYDTTTAGYGPADVTLTGPGGNVRGSLVIDPSHTSFTFVKTGGAIVPATGLFSPSLLAAGSYSVVLFSGSTAFKDMSGGKLDGNSDGIGGDNYTTTFVAAPSGVVVTVPDFARGPDSADRINVPNNASGASYTQFLTFVSVNGGTFKLNFNATTTGAITWSATPATLASNIRSALETLVGVGNVTVTGNGFDPYTVTFAPGVATPGQMTVANNSLTSPNPSIAANVVPTSFVGLPIALSDGNGVQDATFVLNYNADLLTITGGAVNVALPNATLTVVTSGSGSSAQATIAFHSPTPLPAGAVRLGGLVAVVPDAAQYKSKQLLHFSSLSLNGGAIPAIADDGVQAVVFLGDVSGDGLFTSNDSVLLGKTISGSDSGFTAYPVLDPVIVGDIGGNGTLTAAQDGVLLNNYLAGVAVTQMPNYPGAPSNNPSGPDPTLSVPTDLHVGPGGTVTVPVNIDDPHPEGSTGLTQAMIALTYDPTVFSVSAADVRLGSVPAAGTGWTLQTRVDQATGQIGMTLFSATPISAAVAGSLVTIDFHVLPGAAGGLSPINLVGSVNPGGRGAFYTTLSDDQGLLTLHPAPTDSAKDDIDGQVLVLAAPAVPVVEDDAAPAPAPIADAPPAGAAAAVPAEVTKVLDAFTTAKADGVVFPGFGGLVPAVNPVFVAKQAVPAGDGAAQKLTDQVFLALALGDGRTLAADDNGGTGGLLASQLRVLAANAAAAAWTNAGAVPDWSKDLDPAALAAGTTGQKAAAPTTLDDVFAQSKDDLRPAVG